MSSEVVCWPRRLERVVEPEALEDVTTVTTILNQVFYESNSWIFIRISEIFSVYSNELRGIVNRLKDLMIPFQQKWYYTPEMRGSYSIKSVLPALDPELSYNDLEIKEGGAASNTFLSMVTGSFEGDVEEKRRQLLEYCKLDTFAMVRILDKLRQV